MTQEDGKTQNPYDQMSRTQLYDQFKEVSFRGRIWMVDSILKLNQSDPNVVRSYANLIDQPELITDILRLFSEVHDPLLLPIYEQIIRNLNASEAKAHTQQETDRRWVYQCLVKYPENMDQVLSILFGAMQQEVWYDGADALADAMVAMGTEAIPILKEKLKTHQAHVQKDPPSGPGSLVTSILNRALNGLGASWEDVEKPESDKKKKRRWL